MTGILIVSLLLMGTAVALVARAVATSRTRTAETLGKIDVYGYVHRGAGEHRRGFLQESLDQLASLVGGVVARRFGNLQESRLRVQLMAAGLYSMAPRKFVGYRLLSAVVVGITMLWLCAAAGLSAAVVLLGLVLGVLAGWVLPTALVHGRARRRYIQIDYDMPELIDLLVVTVEAGLGLNGSLQLAAERLSGPLGDELRLTLQEQSFGLSTNDSLRNLLARADTPFMRSFIRSIIQGESLGVSIGQIMRTLAHEMRLRRRQAAEEKAQKAPVKILFPLVFLIFPAMFVVLLGPAIFNFMDAF